MPASGWHPRLGFTQHVNAAVKRESGALQVVTKLKVESLQFLTALYPCMHVDIYGLYRTLDSKLDR